MRTTVAIVLIAVSVGAAEPPKGEAKAPPHARVTFRGKGNVMTTFFDGKIEGNELVVANVPLTKLNLTKGRDGRVDVGVYTVEADGGLLFLVIDRPGEALVKGNGLGVLEKEFVVEGTIRAGKRFPRAKEGDTGFEKILSEQALVTFQASHWKDVRPFRGKDKGSIPPLGRVAVLGRAVPGKYDLGGGKVATLAIENADCPLVVIGDLTPEQAQHEGTIRVIGKLDASSSGQVRLHADRVEVSEK